MIVLRTGYSTKDLARQLRIRPLELTICCKVIVWGQINEPVQQFLSMKVLGRDSELRSQVSDQLSNVSLRMTEFQTERVN
jgi:hypothetical protein